MTLSQHRETTFEASLSSHFSLCHVIVSAVCLPSCRRVVSLVLLLGLAMRGVGAEKTDAIDAIVAEYFRPYELENATLSPDGRHVALAQRARSGEIAILIVDVDGRSHKQHFIDKGPEHAVQELLWAAPTRLVFTTSSRAVCVLDIERGEYKPLLYGRDLEGYVPEPELGLRTREVGGRPDLPADPTLADGSTLDLREMTVKEALAQARMSGDLFGSDSVRDPGRALRPHLLGPKPGSTTTVLVEVRSDTELIRRAERTRLTVPGNVYLTDRKAGMADVTDLDPARRVSGDYAAYDIDYAVPPLLVLELDITNGKTRVIERDDGWRRVWLDHTGRVRLVLEQKGASYRYLHRAADSKKWVPLDSVVKTATPLGFAVTSENLLSPRSVPLGFDSAGRVLFFASNVGKDTFALRSLDVVTGELEDFEVSHNRFDLIEPTATVAGDVLRFDPHTRALAGVRFSASRRQTNWFDPGMTALQGALTKKFAPLRCELRQWNAGRTRFLVDVSAPDDPGRFVVADPATGKLVSCGDRAPWLTEERRNPTHEFDFVGDDGRRFAGFLTLPRHPRLNPPPVLVYFHDGPWYSDPPLFNRGAQALSALGFAVLQLNHRGSSGFGRKHLTALADGLDRAVLEDVKVVLARIGAGKQTVNTRLVAAFGNGVGGYLAVRMAQLAPEMFRCAVAINAPGDLEAWCSHPDIAPTLIAEARQGFFGAEPAALRGRSAVTAGPGTKAPVLVVHGTGNTYVPIAMGRELYHALKKGSGDTAWLELPDAGHGGWSGQTTARLFAELGRFFNATIYHYGVKVSPAQVVPEKD